MYDLHDLNNFRSDRWERLRVNNSTMGGAAATKAWSGTTNGICGERYGCEYGPGYGYGYGYGPLFGRQTVEFQFV